MKDTETGFSGVGYLGHGMAKNLVQNGYPMAETCDVIYLCPSNSPQVESVFQGEDGAGLVTVMAAAAKRYFAGRG